MKKYCLCNPMLIGINIPIIILTDDEVTCACEIISETHKEDDKKTIFKTHHKTYHFKFFYMGN